MGNNCINLKLSNFQKLPLLFKKCLEKKIKNAFNFLKIVFFSTADFKFLKIKIFGGLDLDFFDNTDCHREILLNYELI